MTKKRTNKWKFWVIGLVVVVVAGAGYVGRGRMTEKAKANDGAAAPAVTQEVRAVPVVVTAAAVHRFEDILVVQGDLEAKNCSLVSPRIGGAIVTMYVEEGDAVEADKTRLFKIDAENLENALIIKQHDVEVSRCALQERQANLEQVEADLYKAEVDYKRYKKLLAKEVVTANDFELQELRYKQAQASHKHAKTSVALAEEQVRQAQAALLIAEKDLADTVIYAPITGHVSARYQELGEMGDIGKAVLRIDDTKLVEVSAYLPGQFYNRVVPGETQLNLTVSGIEVAGQVVSYKSPTINSKLRTFEIKSVIQNPPAGVVPGAMADIKVVFETRETLGVPSVSVQPRRSGEVIFVVGQDNHVKMIPVKTGLDGDGWTEIVEGDIKAGVSVVSMGQEQLDDGVLVSIQREGL